MAKDKKMLCPMMQKECIEDGAVVNGELCGCRFWIHISGQEPTSGERINKGDCAIAWNPILLIENSQQQRQTGAAVESFRNEMVVANSNVLLAASNKLIGG